MARQSAAKKKTVWARKPVLKPVAQAAGAAVPRLVDPFDNGYAGREHFLTVEQAQRRGWGGKNGKQRVAYSPANKVYDVLLDSTGEPSVFDFSFCSAGGSYRQMMTNAANEIIGRNFVMSSGNRYSIAKLHPLMARFREYFEENSYINNDSRAWFDSMEALALAAGAKWEAVSQKRIDAGQIEFHDVPYLFKVGQPVYTVVEDDQTLGGRIKKVEYGVSWMQGPYYDVSLDVIHVLGGDPTDGVMDVRVWGWSGHESVEELSLRRMAPDVMKALQTRGEKFARFTTNGPAYVSYQGHLTQSSWWSTRRHRADGRVIVDVRTFMQIDNKQYNDEKNNSGLSWQEEERRKMGGKREKRALVADNLWRCVPWVYGLSMRSKTWGKMLVSGMSDIDWRDDAYDSLVLGDDLKKTIRALVENSAGSFSDIVEGKGGGCIFLLHGPPGEGKTLTAETVAELLHRPLYSITVGELGTTPDQLEARLRNILDIATVWNAVVLLDEADIYLEERDERDILRNAMVGVFLRLLEYHQGVLFLTTNRVRNIDTAFYSRVSIAISFEKGDVEKRKKVWTNLLRAAKIDGIDVDELAESGINGRQIKNVIRLAGVLARSNQSKVDTKLMKHIISMVSNFEKDTVAR